MDLHHLGAVGEWLPIVRNAGPVGVNRHGIGEDHIDHGFRFADGDSLPVFVSFERREREAARHLHTVLVLRGDRLAAEHGERHGNKHHQPSWKSHHDLLLLLRS
jgi:hypothetical protein